MRLDHLEQTVNLLLSPADQECTVWRRKVLSGLRSLMEADRAVMLLMQGSECTPYCDVLPQHVIEEYRRDFAPLDYGMVRRDALRLTRWSRRLLWDQRDLLRSAYYNDFALRHDIHDTIGISVDVEGTMAHVRIALLYGTAPLPTDRLDTIFSRVGLVLPVLSTGLGIHLRYEHWLGVIPSMLDQIGERLVLYSRTGRELHRNLTMRHTLEGEPERDRILEAVQRVAHAVTARTQGAGHETGICSTDADGSRRHVQTATACYRVRGCVVGPDTLNADSAVLVSVEPTTPALPPPGVLRERFGLTEREGQVACLLVQRLTNDEIAGRLGISTHTARHHTESVLLKMGVNSRRALQHMLLEQ
ncbi:MAG TPA: helix-turn-helix transcriptional regulator [Gemmatimonadales bacterium]|nr:helix-turn-helix transcriptional regulator [Gemmatimonadales bacterium]